MNVIHLGGPHDDATAPDTQNMRPPHNRIEPHHETKELADLFARLRWGEQRHVAERTARRNQDIAAAAFGFAAGAIAASVIIITVAIIASS